MRRVRKLIQDRTLLGFKVKEGSFGKQLVMGKVGRR